jgi:hypothetical protein
MIGRFSEKSRKMALCLLKSIGFLLNSSNTSSGNLKFGGAPLGSVKIVLKYDHRNNTSMM